MKNNYIFVENYNNDGINNKINTAVNTFGSMLLILISLISSIMEGKFHFFSYKKKYVFVPLEMKVSE